MRILIVIALCLIFAAPAAGQESISAAPRPEILTEDLEVVVTFGLPQFSASSLTAKILAGSTFVAHGSTPKEGYRAIGGNIVLLKEGKYSIVLMIAEHADGGGGSSTLVMKQELEINKPYGFGACGGLCKIYSVVLQRVAPLKEQR